MSKPAPRIQSAVIPTLQDVKHDVDLLLDAFYADAAERAHLLHPEYGRLWDVMDESHAAGGKRLRPFLTMLTYVGFGGTDQRSALQAGAALELLHTSMLIHDDVIDRDYIRHGAPNVPGRYRTIYATYGMDAAQTLHYANSAAILAGDLLLAGAHRLLQRSSFPAQRKLQALELLSEAIFVVGGGELLDTEAAFVQQEAGGSLRIAELKTAHYSFVIPMQMGALLAGAPLTAMPPLVRMGEAIGIAFQLADDLLGMFGDEHVTGKPVASDLTEGKRTYLMECAFEGLDTADAAILTAAFGNAAATDAQKQAAAEVLIRSGAKQRTEAMMQQKLTEASALLDTLPFDDAVRVELRALFDKMVWRQS